MLQKIGEGGFGEIWVADQAEPVRRRVAIKVLTDGMDTKAVLARFEADLARRRPSVLRASAPNRTILTLAALALLARVPIKLLGGIPADVFQEAQGALLARFGFTRATP